MLPNVVSSVASLFGSREALTLVDRVLRYLALTHWGRGDLIAVAFIAGALLGILLGAGVVLWFLRTGSPGSAFAAGLTGRSTEVPVTVTVTQSQHGGLPSPTAHTRIDADGIRRLRRGGGALA